MMIHRGYKQVQISHFWNGHCPPPFSIFLLTTMTVRSSRWVLPQQMKLSYRLSSESILSYSALLSTFPWLTDFLIDGTQAIHSSDRFQVWDMSLRGACYLPDSFNSPFSIRFQHLVAIWHILQLLRHTICGQRCLSLSLVPSCPPSSLKWVAEYQQRCAKCCPPSLWVTFSMHCTLHHPSLEGIHDIGGWHILVLLRRTG